jgi:hypothetical protein
MFPRGAALAAAASLGIALAPPGADAADEPKQPQLEWQFSPVEMCLDCGGGYNGTECEGATTACCRRKLERCWASCDETEGGAGCGQDTDCRKACYAKCRRNAKFCNGGTSPAIGPGFGRMGPGSRSVAPRPPEAPGPAGSRPGGPDAGTVAPGATGESPTRRGPATEGTKDAPPPPGPGYIWVDDHWERARKKK